MIILLQNLRNRRQLLESFAEWNIHEIAVLCILILAKSKSTKCSKKNWRGHCSH